MTRFSMFGAFALLVTTVTGLSAQQPRLSVFACDLREKPIAGARFRVVDVVSSDSSSPTDGSGRTDILLHKAVKAGNLIQVSVTNPDYILVSPWNSRVLVPASDSATVVQLWLYKVGTDLSLRDGRLIITARERLAQAAIPRVTNVQTDRRQQVREALKTIAKQYGIKPEDLEREVTLLTSDDPYERGLKALYLGQYPEAVKQFTDTVQSELKRPAPSDKLVNAGLFLGHAQYLAGDYRQAANAYSQAASLVTNSPDLLNGLAMTLFKTGDLSKAETEFRRVVEIRERENPGSEELAVALTNVGYILQERKKCAEAKPFVSRALEIFEKKFLPGEERLAIANRNVAMANQCIGEYGEAGKYFLRELEVWAQILGRTSPDYAAKLNDYAKNMYEAGEYALAEPAFREALEIFQSKSPDRRTIFWTLRYLGRIKFRLKDYAAAVQFSYSALNELTRDKSDTSTDQAEVYYDLREVYEAQGDTKNAELCYSRILEIRQKQPPSSEREEGIATILRNRAVLVYNQGDYRRAKPLLEEAVQQAERVFPRGHSRIEELRILLENIEKMHTSDRAKLP